MESYSNPGRMTKGTVSDMKVWVTLSWKNIFVEVLAGGGGDPGQVGEGS